MTINLLKLFPVVVMEMPTTHNILLDMGSACTSFDYKNLGISKQRIAKDEKIIITVEVTNAEIIAGKEIVQLYVTDNYATVTPSVKRLRGFNKIHLAPSETRTVTFELKPEELSFVGQDNEWVLEAGTFTVNIGGLNKTNNLKSLNKFIPTQNK
ncbi:MAG: fibronectin type III-like domain-contianing protein [Bacteroidales bacterium]|nr:fibronectin type III-like domain-contianing protein [Bacteroidales bacterium]